MEKNNPETFEKHGLNWHVGTHPLKIEFAFIKRGGFIEKNGVKGGRGLSYHLEQARQLMWPDLDSEEDGQYWHGMCRDTISSHRVTVLMGPGSSGKTHEGAWIGLTMWLADPDNTCVLVSSTDMRGLRLRVWGELTTMWEKAINKFPFLPGHHIDSKLAITKEALTLDGDHNDRVVRNFRSAIVGIPTVQNGKQVGLGKWIGIKQKRVILIADEAQFMGPSFLSAFANLNKNEEFWAIVLGNPLDTLDPLGKAAEPIDGWDGHMEPAKTEIWKTRFLNGACVNLVGTDSPNNQFPVESPRFPYLISQKKINETLSFFPKESFEYYSQCVGVMKIGSLARRVITRRLCEQNHALDAHVTWLDGTRTRIAALDAAWGGDRCTYIRAEFGMSVDRQLMIQIYPPELVPVSARSEKEPEQQIAEWVKARCEHHGITPENFGHDSTGRGSLGTFLARAWSALTNPIEFGGVPTDRPVCADLFINDPKTGERRLKTCREHYIKFVTELWFSVHYTIAAGQMRGLTEDVMEEGIMRQWERRAGDRIELESKTDMKERIGRSPDLFDVLAVVIEMARRRGFVIQKLANDAERPTSSASWIEKRSEAFRQMHKKAQLNYSV